MPNEERVLITAAETIVVKIGSRVLSGIDGHLDTQQVAHVSSQLVKLADAGRQVILVSSGAVASGVGRLGLAKRPSDVSQLQAVAALGQTHLIQTYERYLSEHGRHAVQILLVADDLDDRERYLNVRNTLNAIHQFGMIPIINENDSVAVEELMATFGDNDRLAAIVAGLFGKSALIILSDVDGLFDRNPSEPDAALVHTIPQVTQDVLSLAAAHSSSVSRGGMLSKLKAAQFVTQSGSPVVIAGGRVENVITRIVAGETLGTLFVPQPEGLTPKKRWLAFTAQTNGQIHIDDGAVKALKKSGSSLLPIGVLRITGSFAKGEVVSIRSSDGSEIARGLSNYSAIDLQRIFGQRSTDIAQILGQCPYDEVVHRDNMALV